MNIFNLLKKFFNRDEKIEEIKESFEEPSEYIRNIDKLKSRLEYLKDNLLEKNISFKNKTYVIYNPIDFSLIKELSSESIGYVTDKIKLISVGRLQKEKNIKMLISVINELKRYNIELWIIGDGDEKEKLTEYVNILNLNNIIKFMGFQNNPYKYINAADILILLFW